MAKLILTTGDKAGMEYGVTDGLVLGRRLDAPIHVNDVKASREHAKLVADGERFHVVDLNSTNGTFVNDKRISRALLSHGDQIRIGRTVFTFHDPAAAAPEPAPKEQEKAPAPPKIDLGAPPPKKIKVKLQPGKRRAPPRRRR